MWVNTFHPDDYTRKPGDIGSAEQSVAEKAVFLARKTQDETGDDILTLIIHTQYPELDVTDLKNVVSPEETASPSPLPLTTTTEHSTWRKTTSHATGKLTL